MDYKERFIIEYKELKERFLKLENILVKYDADKLEFQPSCDISILRSQYEIMRKYLYILEVRATIEEIDLIGDDNNGVKK